MRRSASAFLTMTAVFAATAAPADASRSEKIAQVAERTEVAAGAGFVAWSELDEASGKYRLVVRTPSGEVQAPDIARRTGPFDVSLGTLASGAPAAVFSRCRRGGSSGGFVPEAVPRPGRDCGLHLLNLRSGNERDLVALSRPTGDEQRPALSAGRLIFVRKLAARRAKYPLSVVTSRLGRAGERTIFRTGRRLLNVTHLDVTGRRVAFSTLYEVDDCRGPGRDVDKDWQRSDLWLSGLRRGASLTRAAAGCTGWAPDVLFPEVTGRDVVYFRRPPAALVTQGWAAPHPVRTRQTIDSNLFDFAVDAGHSYAVVVAPESTELAFNIVELLPD
jgi:hypothetical protein